MGDKNLTEIAEKAAADLNMPDSPPPSEPKTPPPPADAPAERKPDAVTPPADPKAPPPAKPASEPTLSKADLLAQVKAMMEKKEIVPDEIAFVNSKLQSSFAKLKAVEKNVVEGVKQLLDDKGVILPEGKTVSDVMNEPDGGKAFLELMRSAARAELAPFTAAKSAADLRDEINGQLRLAVETYPDIEPLLPEVGAAIKDNPLLEEAISVPKFIPLVLAGVARDFQYQQAKHEKDQLAAENTKLKELLAAASEADQHGRETSRAANHPTPTSTPGASANVRALAESLYDRAVDTARRQVH